MKKFLLLFCLLPLSFAGFAQSAANKIVTKSGEVIECSEVFPVIPYSHMGYRVGDTDGEETVYILKKDIEYIYMAAEDKNYYFDSYNKLVELPQGVRKVTPELKGRTRFNIGLGISQNPATPVKSAFFANAGAVHYLAGKFGIGATALFKTTPKSPKYDRSSQSVFIGPSFNGSFFLKKNGTYIHLEFAMGYSVTHYGEGSVKLHRGIEQTNQFGAVSLAGGVEFLVSPKTGIEISLRYTIDVMSTQRSDYDREMFRNTPTSVLDYMHGFNGLSIIAGMRF